MDLSRLVLLGAAVAVLCLAIVAYAYYAYSERGPGGIVSLRSELHRVAAVVRERRAEGYAVTDAEYYLLSAAYYYRAGDRERAVAMLEKAREALESAEPLPELPDRGWHPVESNV